MQTQGVFSALYDNIDKTFGAIMKAQLKEVEAQMKREKEEKEQIEAEKVKVQESWSQVHRGLMQKEGELQRERELNLQL